MNKKGKKMKKGFTLVELIVVIAIIGVLAMMITPSIMGYVNKSKVSRNEANAKTVAMAIQAVNADLLQPLKAATAGGTGIITFNGNQWVTTVDTTGGQGDGTTFADEITKMVKLDGTIYATVNDTGAVMGVAYAPKGAAAATSASITASPSEIIGNWQ